MNIFIEQIQLIKDLNYDFIHPENFEKNFNIPKKQKKILITIDDAFQSFYEVAWPFLKENKIPFILFVSTEPVGNKGYMTWDQIKEVEQESFAIIGHHSHSHDYLIDVSNEDFIKDIEIANKIFTEKIGYIPSLFSYPFGEYSEFMRQYISKNFTYAFGQHSGVIDVNKEKFQLPRFPINENYGELKRFTSIIKTYPLEYKKLLPLEKKLNQSNVENIIKNFDIVVDGTDNFTSKFLVNEFSRKLKKIFICGAISKFDGHIFSFNFSKDKRLCLKSFYQTIPNDEVLNCEADGVVGTIASVVGSIQANEVIKNIVGIGKSLNGKVLIINLV